MCMKQNYTPTDALPPNIHNLPPTLLPVCVFINQDVFCLWTNLFETQGLSVLKYYN